MQAIDVVLVSVFLYYIISNTCVYIYVQAKGVPIDYLAFTFIPGYLYFHCSDNKAELGNQVRYFFLSTYIAVVAALIYMIHV